MLNALKTPSRFIEAVEGLNSGVVSKPKRYLPAVFFVLLGAAVFTLFSNQNEKQEPKAQVSSESSQGKTVAPSTKEQRTKPLPGKNKPERTKKDRAPVQEAAASSNEKTLTFKKDKEYLSMNRFERPALEARRPAVARQSVRDTVVVVDKPLVLAGRGFEIQKFQPRASQIVPTDFLEHLTRPVAKRKPVHRERLDLQLIQVKSSRHLIFHPLGPALSQLQKPAHRNDLKRRQKKPHNLESIPETKLLFNESGKSDLLLRPGSESLDLLIGNEKINRREYGSW